ncbi:hypothetical protein GCM10009841_12650 [Microlunatus panaciterrae]|uniref:Fucose 4-O-acetylase-like acetyltransferase n=1 Tax=Microlunatus panaciterrae TaxID=400768 RepID=A0ABS2RM67_9ACTN|nr:acyltransferase family protein [Microlunatus panaciterrae]MBM7799823.1 fucose 4-O-acetylase-like acetyltransferase [Microlunatus panaciterrae]
MAAPAPRRPRSAALDAIRILGIIAIVSGHTWPEQRALHLTISLWQVPAFFLLAGYLWSGNRPLRGDVIHRSKALMRPYFAWLAIIGIPFVIWAWAERGQSPVRLAAGLLYGAQVGRPFSAYWFVAALFLTGVFVRACQLLPRMAVWALAVAGMIAAYLWGPTMAHTPYSVGLVLPCALFVLVGQELRKHRARIAHAELVGLILLAVSAVLVVTGAAAPFDVKYGDFGRPVVSVLAAIGIGVALILLAEYAIARLAPRVQQLITTLAAAGLVVLLAHAAVLYLTDTLAGWPLGLCFALALVVPWSLGVAINRTSLAPWLAGRAYAATLDSGERRPAVSHQT